MTKPIVLDASPLSLLCQRNADLPEVVETRAWLAAKTAAGVRVIVPEIADYEVRRELLRAGKTASVRRLDVLRRTLTFLPVDTAAMLRAAELWARARNAGQPTAPPEALDADVIPAAMAEIAGAVVATENEGHLARFVAARH